MKPHAHIAALAPYPLAALSAPPGKRLISLAQNESLRPPSPAAIAAGQTAMEAGALYPDPDWTELRHALGRAHGLDPHTVLCGSGSLDLIGALARIYTGPKRSMLAPAHAYPFFRSAALLAGARYDTAPEANLCADVDALLEAVRPDTGLVCVANPGNPTGTWLPHAEIARLRAALRADILLLVDEAYGEFAPASERRAFELVQDGRTVVTRTFSKAYGLAGLRVGWGCFPPVIAQEMRKVLNPNNISAPAQAAAVAAVQDAAYMRDTVARTAQLRADVAYALGNAGLRVVPSHTNFLLMDLGTAARAQAVDMRLQREGIFLRAQAGADLPHMLRMTLGPPDDVAVAQARLCAVAQDPQEEAGGGL